MALRPWDEELDARLVVEFIGGGMTLPVDPGGGAEQLHDFDWTTESGDLVAVEVTRHTVQGAMQRLAEIGRRDWTHPSLRGVWHVDTVQSVNVPALHAEVGDLLVMFETAGISSLIPRHSSIDPSLSDDELEPGELETREQLRAAGLESEARRLVDLGVRLIHRFEEASPLPGKVVVGDASTSGSSGVASIVRAVESHANKSDNSTKLRKAENHAERHLFVWIENSHPDAVAAFDFPTTLGLAGLPGGPPELPDHVDAVWAATGFETSHVLRFATDAGWENLGFVHLRELRER